MNRVEQILKDVDNQNIFSTSYKEYTFKMMQQTALEFSKWKDENYIQFQGKFMHRMLYQTTKTTDPLFIRHLKTLDQLFNEWKNQTT